MTQKIQDSNPRVSVGGRLRDYWDERGIEQRRSKAVEWDHKDIDIRALLDEYNLKGFEFGRYVNNEDRYDFLLAAKSALHDLSWLMKTTNLGINGKIGIAFGARGRGGHAIAHYEPVLNMINLTKGSGAGTMAHEYGHALDYNIGGLVDQNKRYRSLSGGRSMSRWLDDNTGGTCRLLMRKLIYEIKMTQSFARLKKASDYWKYNTEVFARFFEQWCCYKLREAKQSNSFLTSSWATYVNFPAYLTEADFKKVLPTGDKLMKNMGMLLNGKKTEPYMDLEVTNPEKVKKAAKPKKEPVKKAAAGKTLKATAPGKQNELVGLYHLENKRGDIRQKALEMFIEDRVLSQKAMYNDMYSYYNMANYYGIDTTEGKKYPWPSIKDRLLKDYGYTEKQVLDTLEKIGTKEALSLKKEIEKHNKQVKSKKQTK